VTNRPPLFCFTRRGLFSRSVGSASPSTLGRHFLHFAFQPFTEILEIETDTCAHWKQDELEKMVNKLKNGRAVQVKPR
jgi:hypothetical protein